jgi:two-component system response regulator LytT
MRKQILIVEDEPISARLLRGIIEDHVGPAATIRMSPTFESARCKLWEQEIDLLFLDLNLRGEDGFGLLEETAAGSFQTIVVSAHADQAIRAFDYGVIDFIPKPLQASRVVQALQRFGERDKFHNLRFLSCVREDIVTLIPIHDIIFAEGADKRSLVHLRSGEFVESRKSLKELQATLPRSFVRVHKSYLVARNCIREIQARADKDYYALLENGKKVPVSRSTYREWKA